MAAAGRPARDSRGSTSGIRGVTPRVSDFSPVIALVNFLERSNPSLLVARSGPSPGLALLGLSPPAALRNSLEHLRNASQGDWQPYLGWLQPRILAGLSDQVTVGAWNRALSEVRVQMQYGVNRDQLRRNQAEAIMRGLEEVLCRVTDVVWDVYSSALKSQRQLEIAERTEELRRSNLELEQFAYVASHDLQEPLRTVVNFTELFAERYGDGLDERGERYVRHIVEGGKRMQALVRALLTYSRVSSQGKELVEVDSQAVLKSVCESMHVTIQATGAEITWGELPTVMADDVQLAQVFQNLIGNAIKFCGSVLPKVQISAHREKDTWVFAVQDNGIGIEAEHAGRLFQMFQRLQPRGQYEGSGIGLALSKRILERHGGQIWFESEPGKGSTFFFNLRAIGMERTDD